MRPSSTRLRFGAALAATTLGLFSLGGSALAENGRGDDHRPDGAGPHRTGVPTEVAGDDDSQVPDPVGDADNQHPSGKDRHEDNGTQGHSAADPDDDGRGPDRTNGGADKPLAVADGAGGRDRLDQDGNNGCGNDDDFEDDNEGRCGARPQPAGPTTTTTSSTTTTTSTTVSTGSSVTTVPGGSPIRVTPATPVVGQVLGVTLERPAASPAPAPTAAPAVLGARVERGALARTGFNTTTLAVAGTVLLLVGLVLARRPSGEHFG